MHLFFEDSKNAFNFSVEIGIEPDLAACLAFFSARLIITKNNRALSTRNNLPSSLNLSIVKGS